MSTSDPPKEFFFAKYTNHSHGLPGLPGTPTECQPHAKLIDVREQADGQTDRHTQPQTPL